MKKIAVFLIMVLAISSCSKDFLNETNPNSLASDNFWKTSGDVDKALAGVFSQLQSNDFYNGNSSGQNAGVYRLDFISDNGYCNYDFINGAAVARGDYSPTDGLINSFWTACYKMIQRSNDFLANVDRVKEVTEANRNTMKAEVRFLRALAYHHLAMCYRDAPLITSPQTLQEAKVPKNTYKELSDFVIKELNEITTGTTLPVTVTKGRVSRGAALALLARFYLYNKNYTEAAATAQKVIDLNVYNLNTTYNTLFTIAGETSRDIIFAVQYAGPGLAAGVGASFNGYFPAAPQVHTVALPNLANAYYCTDGLPITRSPLYNASNPTLNRDPRFNATVVTTNSLFRGAAILATNLAPTKIRLRKWADESAANSTNAFDNGQDFYVLRYAEVLLTRAEALLESGSYTEQQVRDLVNQVRTRATMPKVEVVEGTGLTKQQLIDIVRQERRVETAFEGLRYYDLKRWGILKERAVDVFNSIDKAAATSIQTRNFVPSRHYVWPIPQREIDANSALVQHPEWQ
ncbi:MAG: RagB/SusD family nutrient uptake outer membrane protein [Saprospiraceae bacterium]|nr:RagB/SusD family nutrient uptake outer membrane protein [Saprospiraceae bacterium]